MHYTNYTIWASYDGRNIFVVMKVCQKKNPRDNSFPLGGVVGKNVPHISQSSTASATLLIEPVRLPEIRIIFKKLT